MKNSVIYNKGINDADYKIRWKDESTGKYVKCPYYRRWENMLQRCYSESFHKNNPTYKDCSVCDEWLLFSNFRNWMESQEWGGKHLDKDLLKEGNKVYCPEYCVFVTRLVNNFIEDAGASRGRYAIGTCWYEDRKKFMAYCRNPFTAKRENLGYYKTESEAHFVWKSRKLELARMLSESTHVSDPRVAQALVDRYK